MENTTRINLATCLRSTSAELSEVADGLAGLTSNDEIERQARILDGIAEDASEGAAILRALVVRDRSRGPLPRRALGDTFAASRVSAGMGNNAP